MWPGCTTVPSYGVEGTKKAERCSRHARDRMVDVASKRCGHPGCNIRPSYGVQGTKKREFCAQHP